MIYYVLADLGWVGTIVFWCLWDAGRTERKVLREVSDYWLTSYRREVGYNLKLIEALLDSAQNNNRSSIQSPDLDRPSTPSRGPESIEGRSVDAVHRNQDR